MSKGSSAGKALESSRFGIMAVMAAAIPLAVAGTPITMQPAMVQGMVDYLHFSESLAGYVASAEIFGLMVGSVLFTFFAKRMNWRLAFAVGMIVAAVANVATIGAISFNLPQYVLPLRGIAGFGAGLTTTIAWAALGLGKNPERNLGWGVAAIIAWPMVGFWILPWLFSLGHYSAFLIAYSLSLVVCLVFALFVPRGAGAAEEPAPHGVSLVSPTGLTALISFLAFSVGFPAAYTYMSLIGRNLGLNDVQVSSALSISQIFGVIGALSMAWACRYFGYLLTSLVVLGGGAAIILAFGLPMGQQGYLSLNCAFQFAWNAGLPLILSVIAIRGASNVLLRFAIPLQFIGMAAAPGFAALLLTQQGYGRVVAGSAVLAVVSLLAFLPILMHKPRHGQSAKSGPLPVSDNTAKETSVLIIGTADTKADEIQFLAACIAELGVRGLVMDVGVLGQPKFRVDFSNRDVAAAAGTTIEKIIALGDENLAMTKMAEGASALTLRLYREGRIQGMIALGGSMGTDLALDVADALPLGVPKYIVSTIAFSPVIQIERFSPDLQMILWSGGLYGLNSLCKSVLSQAAGAIAGACRAVRPPVAEKPRIGMTSLGKSCLSYMVPLVPALEKRGYEVAVFHATGMGGRAFETLAARGEFVAVMDFALCEITNALLGGVLTAGDNRLEGASKRGIPQLLAPGGTDMCDFPTWRELPSAVKSRDYHAHNRLISSVGTTGEERRELARVIGEKLKLATGPAAFIMPLRGIEAWDREGEAMHNPEALAAFAAGIREHIRPPAELVEIDAHINDQAFAEKALAIFDEWVEKGLIPRGVTG